MSVSKLPLLPHTQMCQSQIYNDTRFEARPQFYRQGNSHDGKWLDMPLQAPYYETDTPLMSYNLMLDREPSGIFKPLWNASPCAPMAIKYCSFGKSNYEYDHKFPSVTIPEQPCTFRAKTNVPDITCLDQQNLMEDDRLTLALKQIKAGL